METKISSIEGGMIPKKYIFGIPENRGIWLVPVPEKRKENEIGRCYPPGDQLFFFLRMNSTLLFFCLFSGVELSTRGLLSPYPTVDNLSAAIPFSIR